MSFFALNPNKYGKWKDESVTHSCKICRKGKNFGIFGIVTNSLQLSSLGIVKFENNGG